MASTTTYIDAVNSVLRALNQTEVSASNFPSPAGSSGAREINQVKAIVLEAYRELQNKRPDSFWEDSDEIFLAERFSLSGQKIDADYASGQGIEVSNGGTSFTLYSNDLATSSLANATVTATDLMIHVIGDTQWYKIATLTPATGSGSIADAYLGEDHAAPSSSVAGQSCELVQYRTSLPSDFRDTLNFYGANVGVDVQHVSVNRMIEHISNNSIVLTDSFPSEYAIGYDESSTAVRKLWWYPYVSEDRLMTLRYQRQQTVPSVAGDVFDLEEDYVPQLLNRAKVQACIEVIGGERGFQMASVYRDIEREKRGDMAMKQMERANQQRLVSSQGEDRIHFQEGTGVERVDRRIFLRR